MAPPPPLPPPQFEPIPDGYSPHGLPPDENHDEHIRGRLGFLASRYQHFRWPGDRYHGWGGWGYAVLRTVYTPESDTLFPLALARLRALVRYWCHYSRFPMFGPACERVKVDDGRWNEELASRFWLDVVEDREGLEWLDSGAAALEGGELARFSALAEYFRQWCAGVDTQSTWGDMRDQDPRFTSCLVVDAESLAALVQIPEELPELRCPATKSEKRDTMGTGYPAWMWLVEAKYMAMSPARRAEAKFGGDDAYPGWLRVEPRDLFPTWMQHWMIYEKCSSFLCMEHAEVPEGSGVYEYSPQ